VTEVACYAMTFESVQSSGRTHPGIYAKILTNIIGEIADTVRFSNETLRAFEY